MKLLTICIPTYNRCKFVITQLDFFYKELSSKFDLIEIIVADNFSDTEHRDSLIEYHRIYPFFTLYLNETNLGLIGNIYFLLNKVRSDYVWFVGDDDIIKDGAIDAILKNIQPKLANYLFLNFMTFKDDANSAVSNLNLLGLNGLVTNTLDFSVRFFNENRGQCMFITAGIFKTKEIKQLSNIRRNHSITDPLLFFFMAARSCVFIEDNYFVLDRISNTSWKKDEFNVFSWRIPYTLIELVELSLYDKLLVSEMLISYFKKEKNYIFMIFLAPYDIKKKIVHYVKGENLLLITISVKFLISLFFKKLKTALVK